MIKQKGGYYPFAILNTDRSNLPGTHWWSYFYLIAMVLQVLKHLSTKMIMI